MKIPINVYGLISDFMVFGLRFQLNLKLSRV